MGGLTLSQGGGPAVAIAGRAGVGILSDAPWHWTAFGEPGCHRVELMPLAHLVSVGDELRYAALPCFAPEAVEPDDRFAATAFAVDLLFSDGTWLSEAGLTDQHGVELTAAAQGASKVLVVDQWTLKRVDLTPLAGRSVVAAYLTVAVPPLAEAGLAQIEGWVDGVRIAPAPARPQRPCEWVRTTRGSHSSYSYSRGNTAPLVAVPHGAIMAMPVTRAGEKYRQYAWQAHADDGGTTHLQALATTLSPSVWIGERAAFQVMPQLADGAPDCDRERRQLAFDHADEIDRPHYYRVALAGGILAELTAARHCVAMRFTFPSDDGCLILDQIEGGGGVRVTVEEGFATITGWVDTVLDLVPVVPRVFVHGRLTVPVREYEYAPQPGRDGVTAWVRVAAPAGTPVELTLATSFISLDQARANYDHDDAGAGFDAMRRRCADAWDGVLGRVRVEGATEDQLTTLYSNLYRLHLFPNRAEENAGTAQAPRWIYASPFEQEQSPATGTHTGLAVREGRLTVNTGYWDSYRANWPALHLLDPVGAGAMLDGVVEHYRASGWVPRWSAPGHVDAMVGTSSDVVFADAAVKGVPGFDLEEAYDAALRNATTVPPTPAVGRKGLHWSAFLGWTPTDIAEGLSWTLESAINDFGIAAFSEHLAVHGPAARREEFQTNAIYFRSRALSYVHLYDAAVGFFQGRDRSGRFRRPPGEYDPGLWGHDYTETNGWGMLFSAPHDGAGLAGLFGGRERLGERLDEFFSTPEPGGEAVRGSYADVIHEIPEARNIRMGMFALSNQPAHHVPGMYLHAGRPDRTQAIVRECLRRLFVGSELGQGYPGDEDNGEMSAWWLFNALGLYPLVVGAAGYAVTSPLFERATVTLATGAIIEIVAHHNSPTNVYVQQLRVNGEPWSSSWLPHEVLAAGARLDFTMGPRPSTWATGIDEAPPSLTEPGAYPRPLHDHTAGAVVRVLSAPDDSAAAVLVDDDSSYSLTLDTGEIVEVVLASPLRPVLYTVTLQHAGSASWSLWGRRPDGAWRRLHRRTELFRWDQQTRPFRFPDGTKVTAVRLRNDGPPVAVSEFEIYA